MSIQIPTCQVRQRVENWPYVAACKKTASHNIVRDFRADVGGIEFICNSHAEDMRNGFGEKSVQRVTFDASGDSLRLIISEGDSTVGENGELPD